MSSLFLIIGQAKQIPALAKLQLSFVINHVWILHIIQICIHSLPTFPMMPV